MIEVERMAKLLNLCPSCMAKNPLLKDLHLMVCRSWTRLNLKSPDGAGEKLPAEMMMSKQLLPVHCCAEIACCAAFCTPEGCLDITIASWNMLKLPACCRDLTWTWSQPTSCVVSIADWIFVVRLSVEFFSLVSVTAGMMSLAV